MAEAKRRKYEIRAKDKVSGPLVISLLLKEIDPDSDNTNAGDGLLIANTIASREAIEGLKGVRDVFVSGEGFTANTISAPIFDDVEKWIRENGADLTTDNVSAVIPTSEWNPDGDMMFKDKEAGTTKTRTLADHVRAMHQLCAEVGKTLFVGGIKSPQELVDPGNWDAEVVDAYWQFVYYGECIYG